MIILGIHGGVTNNQHDPGAALVRDGQIVAVCEEERFNRVKSPRGFLPVYSIRACLREAKIRIEDVDRVVHAGETYEDMPERIRLYMLHYFGHAPKVQMINHQLAHLASAFYCSEFEDAMVISYDAVGDRISTALAVADPGGIRILETHDLNNSLGIFYAIMTSFLGFEVSDGEYKVMGLAPYGKPNVDLSPFARPDLERGYVVNPEFTKRTPPNLSVFEPYYNEKLVELLGKPRQPGDTVNEHYRNIAAATQDTLERCVSSLVEYFQRKTGKDSLCLAGGVALNCSANRILHKLPCVKRLFVQPAASDRGLPLGSALQASFEEGEPIRGLKHVFYGPSYNEDDIVSALRLTGVSYVEDPEAPKTAARLIDQGKIIGWWQGRAEFGPRALGNRSILADTRRPDMKNQINTKIKFREEFRPFAPAVLEERAGSIFDIEGASPFMTMAFDVREGWKEKIPAVTHVNGTARVQTVDAGTNKPYYDLIREFDRVTDVPVVLNTSFNIKGQPIVETPLDALSTFFSTGMDTLFLGRFRVEK